MKDSGSKLVSRRLRVCATQCRCSLVSTDKRKMWPVSLDSPGWIERFF